MPGAQEKTPAIERRTPNTEHRSCALRSGLLAAGFVLALCAGRSPAAEPAPKAAEPGRVYISAEYRDLDYQRGIGVVVGDVRFMPPGSEAIIMADAGVIWFNQKEAYLEGNIRICKTLGKAVSPRDFDVPRPDLADRVGLEPRESLEKAGDLDDLIEPDFPKALLIDTRAAISEAERLYVNWADGTAYLVRPTLRFGEAERIANWVVSAPSATGIATYRIPIHDKDGKFTGKYERRSHYVLKNPTFTACSFKEPHTRFTATSGEMVEGDYAEMKNVLFFAGAVPIFYFPYLYKDLEYKWPHLRASVGSSSRRGIFVSAMLDMELIRGVSVMPRVDFMSERGTAVGLGVEYKFGHEKEIRGALDAWWLPSDKGTDALADTSRRGSGWPAGWTPAIAAALGPLPNDLALGTDGRYRVKFTHQQEYPEGWEFDLEFQKFSDAGVYREFFEKEFKTEKDPETQALLKYGRDNWAVFIHVKKQMNDFITETEYLPQLGFNMIAQPLGGGFLFSSDTELAYVRTLYGDVFRRIGQSELDITRIWLQRDEYSRPPALSLRQNDTDNLAGWRFDTIDVVSRPFEWGVFDIEPYVGMRWSWFEHGIDSRRGAYAAETPPVGPPLPPAIAVLPDHTGRQLRSQVLAGTRIATQFYRVYDVSDRPVLSRFFPNGMRHIITPEINYTFESTPSVRERSLPDNDTVTNQDGLHRINFALRNRWQTKWAPEIERDPRAPVGGEWYRRKLAVEKAKETEPVDVIDLDVDMDFFPDPSRDNVNLRGQRVRSFSNLRTDLALRPSKKTTIFFDTEVNPQGSGGLEVVSAGVKREVRPGLAFSLRESYHFHDASIIGAAADWEIDPKWHLRFDLQYDLKSGQGWDRTIELTRRFHEWQLTLGYEFDKGKNESIGTIHVGPSRTEMYRPSWRFQPRSVTAFELAETAR